MNFWWSLMHSKSNKVDTIMFLNGSSSLLSPPHPPRRLHRSPSALKTSSLFFHDAISSSSPSSSSSTNTFTRLCPWWRDASSIQMSYKLGGWAETFSWHHQTASPLPPPDWESIAKLKPPSLACSQQPPPPTLAVNVICRLMFIFCCCSRRNCCSCDGARLAKLSTHKI